MPIDTLNDMIFGFTVILGILLLYVVSLLLRFKREKRNAEHQKKQDKS
jgi:hypothetical protein